MQMYILRSHTQTQKRVQLNGSQGQNQHHTDEDMIIDYSLMLRRQVLCKLAGKLSDHFHGGREPVLQVPHLILLPIPLSHHQRHGLHARKPIQVLVL